MEEEVIMLCIKLLAAYEEWCTVCIRGGTGVKWTDGKELNFVRKKIVNMQEEMKKSGFSIPGGILMEPPPLVEEEFMHGMDHLRRDPRAVLNVLCTYTFVGVHFIYIIFFYFAKI